MARRSRAPTARGACRRRGQSPARRRALREDGRSNGPVSMRCPSIGGTSPRGDRPAAVSPAPAFRRRAVQRRSPLRQHDRAVRTGEMYSVERPLVSGFARCALSRASHAWRRAPGLRFRGALARARLTLRAPFATTLAGSDRHVVSSITDFRRSAAFVTARESPDSGLPVAGCHASRSTPFSAWPTLAQERD